MLELNEVHDRARNILKGICRVCPVCDGRSCPSGVPGMGGRGSGAGFRNNRMALDRVLLNLRTMHNADQPSTDYELYDLKLDMPVMGAPMCETTYNYLARVDDEAFIQSQVIGAESSVTLAFVGDSPAPELYTMGLRAISEHAASKGIPIIKPRLPEEIIAHIRMAEKSGVTAVGIDIDAAAFVTFTRANRPVGPLSESKLRRIINSTELPVILKGVMTADEAVKAIYCGASAIVVSNHGGRALDHTPGTAEVLPEIVSAVQGEIRVLIDGGIRSGEDILKVLALGADAVLIGRPVAIAAIGAESEGVHLLFEQYKHELKRAMLLTGCKDLSSIGSHVIRQ